MGKDTNKQFNWRAFVSVLTTLSFIAMTFTGVILFVVPPGRIANWTGWTMIALTKHQWVGLHVWFSLIFMIASGFHVYLNWNPLVRYFKSKASHAFALRPEWVLALVISAVVFVCTLGNVAPFSSLLEWNEAIKYSWDTPRQRAPIPHAELLTFTELAEQVQDVNLETMLANLKAKGIEAGSPDVVIGELAEASKMTPMQLYDLALGQSGHSRGRAGQGGRGHGQGRGQAGQFADANHVQAGPGPGRGLGRLTLKQYCDQIGMDINASVDKLKKAGFEATPDMTIRAIAETVGVLPSEIRTVLEPQTQ